MIQTNLDFMDENEILEEAREKHKTIPETVRDISYSEIIIKEYTNTQRSLIDKLFDEHPEGLTDT